jgi:hypothetical protein
MCVVKCTCGGVGHCFGSFVFGSLIFCFFVLFVSVFVPTGHYQLILVVVHVCSCVFE